MNMHDDSFKQAIQHLATIKDAVLGLCELTDDEEQKEYFALTTTRAFHKVAEAYGMSYYAVYEIVMHPCDHPEYF